MNRKPANAYDSDDSASDWDSTTAGESPVRVIPPPTFKTVKEDEQDGDYATVTPKSRLNLRGEDQGVSVSSPKRTPRTKDIPRRKNEVFSPPPHLTSFKNALSDYSDVYSEPTPNVPPKMYGDRGQVYNVPDTDRASPPQVNWDDSDAEEKVLQELRQNMEKERQKQEVRLLESERELKSVIASDNQGYEPSSQTEGTSKSVLEQWAKENTSRSAVSHPKNNTDKNSRALRSDKHKKNKDRKAAMLPVPVDPLLEKKCIFYFENASHRTLEADDDNVDAYLPDKIENIERLFKRVWREMFSILRIITSFFVLFATEFLSLIIHHVLQPLVLDSLTAFGNYFFKPLMTIVFNMIIQPFFALVWNTFNVLHMVMGPIIKLLGDIFSKIAIVLESFKLFHITYHNHHPPPQLKQPEIV